MPVDPLQLLPIPMILTLIALFILAVGYDLRTGRSQKNKKETLYRCRHCRLIYTATRHTPTARCPGCGKQNPAVRSR
jgi:rRNA maturation endonuclease Nob1